MRLALIAAVAALAVAGCASAPSSTGDSVALQRVALESVATIAVGRVITRDHADAAKQTERAARIVLIANTLQALGEDALSTLPAATEALRPLLDKAGLDPLERSQADILVNALLTVALERVKLDGGSTTFATVNLVLDQVKKAAGYFLPAAAPPA